MSPDQHQINAFVGSQPGASFLQTWDWKVFQEALGREAHAMMIDQPNQASVIYIIQKLPLGQKYFFCPRGPVAKSSKALEKILQTLKHEAKKQAAVFLRVEPLINPRGLVPLMESHSIHPKHSWILDLRESEESLLSAMKQKTRYNVRLAEKKGVRVENTNQAEDISPFYHLLSETYHRQGIQTYDAHYFQTLLHVLGKQDPQHRKHVSARLYFARLNKKIIAANLMIYFGDTATYLHGGSSYEHRDVMAPYLLQWQAILDAKHLGYSFYDFWGVAPPQSSSSHTWSGITRFKHGFGGKGISFPGTFDHPLAPLRYRGYQMLRKWRK